MTIKMRLDTDGLRALIKDNPELELEIGKEVLKNIKQDQVQGAVMAQIEAVLKGKCSSSGWGSTMKYTVNDPKLKAAIAATVSEAVKAELDIALKHVLEDRVALVTDQLRRTLTNEVRGMIAATITPEMAKEILMEKLLK